MVILTGRAPSAMQLDLLTERSRKFYDGTYEWVGFEGFMDEKGVYRHFSDTPDARPPTPLPPSPLSDDEEDDADRQTSSCFALNDDNDSRLDITHSTPPALFSNHLLQQKGVPAGKTLPRSDLFLDKDEISRTRLIGRLEGMLIGLWLGRGLSLADAYQKVGLEYPDAIANFGLGQVADEPAKSPFSDISGMTDVSDPPSALESPTKCTQTIDGRGETNSTPVTATKEQTSRPLGKDKRKKRKKADKEEDDEMEVREGPEGLLGCPGSLKNRPHYEGACSGWIFPIR
ncbi:hypothetical protein K491DRAFT_674566 [Lophiostoma macrostomum CBS 122681]|uniref:Uncharacterized protein n=1 Tax=Lophiostoma macrostomum CBS 122681 TaxID=1314788 RepID=A0A6A6TNU9_9PLEO|nr:hypothetical protein K491DRAFT_674566 [Lophiostoma macrostomum CBS 122681]